MSFSSAYFKHRNLLGLEGLSRPAILYLLDLVRDAAAEPQAFARVSRLAGRKIVTLFPDAPEGGEAFVEAGRLMGAEVFHAPLREIGATLSEIAGDVKALRPDLAVIGSSQAGVAGTLCRKLDCAVLNASDGAHEAPIAALALAAAIFRARGAVDGKTVVICGDCLHSGVARSLLILLTCLGARVRLAGPSHLAPPALGRLGVEVFSDLGAGLRDADVVIVLPLDLARSGAALVSPREYRHLYGLDAARLALARPDALALHAGRLVPGVEIAESPREGGILALQDDLLMPARMAALEALARNLAENSAQA